MAKGKPSKRRTANQIAWDNELKRIQKAAKRIEKQGYTFPSPFVPEKPARITKKQLQEIKKITPKTLRKQATQIAQDLSKQEEQKPKKVQKKQRQSMPTKSSIGTAQYIPEQSHVVLDNVRDLISAWEPQRNWSQYFSRVKEKDKNILSNILEGAINTEGENAVARRMENHAIEIMDIVNRTLYESGGKTGRDQVQIDLQRFSAIIMGRSLSVSESKDITESIEEMGYENPDE